MASGIVETVTAFSHSPGQVNQGTLSQEPQSLEPFFELEFFGFSCDASGIYFYFFFLHTQDNAVYQAACYISIFIE